METKEQILKNIIFEIARSSKYSKSIFAKYLEMNKSFQLYQKSIMTKNQQEIELLLAKEEFAGVTQDKLIDYVKTDKMPPKLREEIIKFKSIVISNVNKEELEYPKFNWLELQKMNIGLIDVLNTYELIDKRKIMCFFKKIYKKF